MLISNEILWTIQLVQIFYHSTRRHIYDCRTGRHKAKPQVSAPCSAPLFPFLAHTFCVCVQPAGHSFCCCCCFCLGLFCMCYQANRSSAKVRNNKISKFAFGHFSCCCCTRIIGLMCTPYLVVPFPLPHLHLLFFHCPMQDKYWANYSYKFVFPFAHFYACGMWHAAVASVVLHPSLPLSLSILLTFEFEFKHNTQIHTLLNLNWIPELDKHKHTHKKNSFSFSLFCKYLCLLDGQISIIKTADLCIRMPMLLSFNWKS